MLAVFYSEVVNGNDIGMVQGGDGMGLAFEAFAALGVSGCVFAQDFDGHIAIETRIVRAVDFAHAAGS